MIQRALPAFVTQNVSRETILTMNEKKRWIQGIKCWAALACAVLFLCSAGLHYSIPGSLTGFLISVSVFLKNLFPDHYQARRILLRMEHPSLFRGIRTGLLILLTIAAAESVLILTALFPSLPEEGLPVTVILCGSGVNHDGTVSMIGMTRIDAVMSWIQKHPEAPIIVSGGNYSDQLPSEAEAMKNELVKRGVREDRIYLEPSSLTTRENLRYSSKVIEENHLPKTVLIASSEFHLYRCCLYAKRNGLDPYHVPGRTPWYLLPVCWIRELYGILLAYTTAI